MFESGEASAPESRPPGHPPAMRVLLNRTSALLARTTSLTSRLGQRVSRLVDPVVRPVSSRLGRPLPSRPRLALADGSTSSEPTESGPDLPYHTVAGTRLGTGRVALSFEGSNVRLLQFGGERVLGWTDLPLPEETVRGGLVVDAAGLGAALDEIFAQLRLPRRGVLGSLSGLRASAALLELPWLREEDDAGAVVDEAQRALGINPDETFLFWQRIPGRRRDRFVYILAVPREPLLLALEACDVARIQVAELELKPLALARAVNQRDAVIGSLELDSLDVVVVVDDLPILFRSLSLPSGLVSREPAQEHLVAEIVQALSHYEDAAPGHLLDPNAPIYLRGADTGGIALAERIRAQTGHPIGHLSSPLVCPSDFPLADQLVNVGLALKRA